MLNVSTLQVQATDRDAGQNAQMTFRLTGGQDDVFSINPSSGSIQTVKSLDFGKKPYYQITVQATDKGNPSLSGTTIVVVNVEGEHLQHFLF